MAAEAFLRFDATSRNAVLDPADATRHSTLLEIVAFVRVDLPRAPARAPRPSAFQRRNRVQQLFEELTVVDVGRGQADRERNPFGVDHKMALAARSALIRRIRAEAIAPLFAATLELSMAARLQSISPAQLNSSRTTR